MLSAEAVSSGDIMMVFATLANRSDLASRVLVRMARGQAVGLLRVFKIGLRRVASVKSRDGHLCCVLVQAVARNQPLSKWILHKFCIAMAFLDGWSVLDFEPGAFDYMEIASSIHCLSTLALRLRHLLTA